MSANRIGIASGTVVAQPDFVATVTAEGGLFIKQSYKFLTGDWSNVASKFAKGTPISDLYPQCESAFAGAVIDAYSPAIERGGWTAITVDFVGQYDASAEYADRPVTYSRNAALTTRSILEHPRYLRDTRGGSAGVAALHAGTGTLKRGLPSDKADVLDIVTQSSIQYITDEETLRWLRWVEKGLREYEVPTMEWTVSRTTDVALSSGDFTRLGKTDNPEGNPGNAPDMDWIYIGATEEIRSGLNTYTKTWQEREISDLPWKAIFA
jgi:hypothetical protein